MVNLEKGQGVDLTKEAPNLKRILIGLGWDPIKSLLGGTMDIDSSVICCKASGGCESVISYKKLRHPSGAIKHNGDNLTGAGDGDDEQIEINLDRIPENIDRLSIIINIFSAYSKGQHFGKVKNCFVHVSDLDTGADLVRYDVNGNFNDKTGIFVADLYRHNGTWKFKAVGEGVKVRDIDEMVAIKCR